MKLPAELKDLKVALVCDWLLGVGGAEKVVLAVHELFPAAPIYTSQYDPKLVDWFDNMDVRTGWLNRLSPKLKKFLPILRAQYFSHLDLTAYDLVISLNISEAKGVKTRPTALHVSYMQGPPTQYYWGLYDDFIKDPGFGKFDWLARIGLKTFVTRQRKIDYKFAQNPNYIIANSTYVAKEVKKYYDRDSIVICPPVEVDKFHNSSKSKRDGFLIAGRQSPWKKVDLAIKTCIQTGDKLTVLGNGSEHNKLVKLAREHNNIKIAPAYNGAPELLKYLVAARALIFPSLEPFGIVPVEALSAGTPVIAYGKGGALDYVQDSKNGILFNSQTVSSLKSAIKKFNKTKFNRQLVAKSADKFSNANFKRQIVDYLAECIKSHA